MVTKNLEKIKESKTKAFTPKISEGDKRIFERHCAVKKPVYLARTEGKYYFVDQNQLCKKEQIWFETT